MLQKQHRLRLSKNRSSRIIGGKESVKENRQGCLSRSIKPAFQTDLKFEKPHERVKKRLFDTQSDDAEKLSAAE